MQTNDDIFSEGCTKCIGLDFSTRSHESEKRLIKKCPAPIMSGTTLVSSCDGVSFGSDSK